MPLARKVRWIPLAILLVCTVGCDQVTKHIARTGLSHRESVVLPGGWVELTLAENPGSFLSLGYLLPETVRFTIFTLGVGTGLMALLVYLTNRASISSANFIGLSLIMAGGMSNLLDRLFRHGRVTDFVAIHIGPPHTGIFNAADVLIMAGFAVLIWKIRRNAPHQHHP